jgi:hypothetical protein
MDLEKLGRRRNKWTTADKRFLEQLQIQFPGEDA